MKSLQFHVAILLKSSTILKLGKVLKITSTLNKVRNNRRVSSIFHNGKAIRVHSLCSDPKNESATIHWNVIHTSQLRYKHRHKNAHIPNMHTHAHTVSGRESHAHTFIVQPRDRFSTHTKHCMHFILNESSENGDAFARN